MGLFICEEAVFCVLYLPLIVDMEFITCYRAIPQSANRPSAGGTVWACEELYDSRITAMYPHAKWVEIVVAVYKTAPYVTSEDGGATGFGEEDGWYSFPTSMIYQWREVGGSRWKNGGAYLKYSKEFKAQMELKEKETRKRKQLYIQNGVDYEAILKQAGLSLIE